MSRPRVLIEDWLPIAEIGVESRRERGASSALPPLYFLHVWWARRPLMASRAAVLGSLLPAWSEDWPQHLRRRFPAERDYQEWFVNLLGVRGDPVAARERIRWANERSIKLDRAYDGPRAFTLGPDAEQLSVLDDLLGLIWGDEKPRVLDPMAGGGSIPFESLRFGLPTFANELNAVASLILQGTIRYPGMLGPGLAEDIARWGHRWAEAVQARLAPFFPRLPGESVQAYIYARTVPCPDTGYPAPLLPNLWLGKQPRPAAVSFDLDHESGRIGVDVVDPTSRTFDPDEGTLIRGAGRSLWTGAPIPKPYIKSEAQAGRMDDFLYAVATKTEDGKSFRPPTSEDRDALLAAQEALAEQRNTWLKNGIFPTEQFPAPVPKHDIRPYGFLTWLDFFADRQLLSFGIALEELAEVRAEMNAELNAERADAVLLYLAFALDKAVSYNSRQSRWDPNRGIRNCFERHDFSLKWTFAEFDAAHNLLPWSVSQVADAYRGIADLVEPTRVALLRPAQGGLGMPVSVSRGDAGRMDLADASVRAVVVDPPYYDNVQYAQLSNFFYVWLRRSLGDSNFAEFLSGDLVDSANEAVANVARFSEIDAKRKYELARSDYEKKMTRVFAEASRVLTMDGVLTVMFTHKKVEAWDSLGRSLIDGGFEIEASWPVHTESTHSQHIARKASAASTILLSCRKRLKGREPVWWDDLQAEVRHVAREKASEFLAAGIDGVDVYISTFGPALSVISRQWPVYTSEVDPETGDPRSLRPEEALDLARQEVADLRRQGLLLGRKVEFDPVTDWYLLAWDAFSAVEFPYDEARKLALALGLDLDGELVASRVVSKKGSSVVLQEPRQRRRPGLADPEELTFSRLIDAAHALMVVYREDGVRGAESFLRRTRLGGDEGFVALLQALVNAIPRTKQKGKFVRPEAAALDGVSVLFPDLVIPEEAEIVLEPSQGSLDFDSVEDADEDESDEDDGDGEDE